MFAAKRVRIDIDLAVSFLCTWVSSPTVHDGKKLKRVIRYLKSTPKLRQTMDMDGNMYMHSWVDMSYAMHCDMRGYTKGVVSLGKGTGQGYGK